MSRTQTFDQIVAEVKKTPPDLKKSWNLTEDYERFEGIEESSCHEMRENQFVTFLGRLGWEFGASGRHRKLDCIFMSVSRPFAPKHSNRSKKIIAPGEISHQSKIFGYNAHDLEGVIRREVRHYAYVERCLFKFPEHFKEINSFLISLLNTDYLKRDYFPTEYWKYLELTGDPPSKTSLKLIKKPSINIPTTPEIKLISPTSQEPLQPSESEIITQLIFPNVPSEIKQTTSPEIAVAPEIAINTDMEISKNIESLFAPEPLETTIGDYLDQFEVQKNNLRKEKIFDYLDQRRITAIAPENWDTTVIKISTSRQIKKDLVEKILIENGFTKPPKLPQISKPKETPKKVTMETPTKTPPKSKVYLLRKDDKVFAYFHEDLAKVLAQGLGTLVETIEINPESLEEFALRAMKS